MDNNTNIKILMHIKDDVAEVKASIARMEAHHVNLLTEVTDHKKKISVLEQRHNYVVGIILFVSFVAGLAKAFL